MALKSNNTAASTATFESPDDGLEQVVDTAQAEASTDTGAADAAADTAVAETAPKTTALSKPAGTAVTATAVMKMNVLSELSEAFRVDYDSLPAMQASLGTFVMKADETDLGAEVSLQLMSYQQSWVASPNDTKADVELVKYSDDGKTSRDGVDLVAHVADLKEQGYSKAKINHRVILVGELVSTKSGAGPVGDLVQIDLPDSGRRSFNTYTIQASYAVGKGRKTAQEAAVLTLKAVNDKTKSGEKYTKVVVG
jgi:hypothetical protein